MSIECTVMKFLLIDLKYIRLLCQGRIAHSVRAEYGVYAKSVSVYLCLVAASLVAVTVAAGNFLWG